MTVNNIAANPSRSLDSSPDRNIGRLILRWLALTLLGILAAAALAYVGDYITFVLRGHPQDQVTVTRYMTAPLKGGNKTEYYFEGSGPETCAKALFPQDGWSPCWYLRRHRLYAEKA
jgi:hypothetical protein